MSARTKQRKEQLVMCRKAASSYLLNYKLVFPIRNTSLLAQLDAVKTEAERIDSNRKKHLTFVRILAGIVDLRNYQRMLNLLSDLKKRVGYS